MDKKNNRKTIDMSKNINVTGPLHYKINGQDTLFLTEAFNFQRGSALKYIIRAGRKEPIKGQTKKDKEVEDLEKAVFFLNREINLLKLK